MLFADCKKFGFEQILCVLCAFAVGNPAPQSTPRAQSYFRLHFFASTNTIIVQWPQRNTYKGRLCLCQLKEKRITRNARYAAVKFIR
jgi:hypothetical protein